MIGRNTYLNFVGPSDMWQFLICQFNDTWHHLICSLIFNLISLVTHVNLGFVTTFDVAICNWLSNFCFLQGVNCKLKMDHVQIKALYIMLVYELL